MVSQATSSTRPDIRKDPAVHVSLSSDSIVKQRSLNLTDPDSVFPRLPGGCASSKSGRSAAARKERVAGVRGVLGPARWRVNINLKNRQTPFPQAPPRLSEIAPQPLFRH